MGYYLDLSKISLDQFRKKLESTQLMPSQKILKENSEEKFNTIKAQNIKNMHELQQALKTKDRVNKFSEATSLPVDYLTILRREVNSYHPQARKIKDFPCLQEKTIHELMKLGIKTTVDLYERIVTKAQREKLKQQINIDENEVLLLAKLTDVSRLRYVNQAFATLLVSTKYDTVEKIQKVDYLELHDHLMDVNTGKKYFRGSIALEDMKLFVDDSKYVSLDIEF